MTPKARRSGGTSEAGTQEGAPLWSDEPDVSPVSLLLALAPQGPPLKGLYPWGRGCLAPTSEPLFQELYLNCFS